MSWLLEVTMVGPSGSEDFKCFHQSALQLTQHLSYFLSQDLPLPKVHENSTLTST